MNEVITNIWGNPGCELPNSKLCNACCVLPNIELEGNYTSLVKPAHSPCPSLNSEKNKHGQGCGLHGNKKPDACKAWHCSKADLNGKIDLIAQGVSSGQVSENEAIFSATKLLGRDATETVLSRSAKLSEITYKRELMERYLDET